MWKKPALTACAAVALSSAVFLLFNGAEKDDAGDGEVRSHSVSAGGRASRSGSEKAVRSALSADEPAVRNAAPADTVTDGEPALSDEEKREAEEMASVDAFDALTDKWMEPVKDGVPMKVIEEFSERFRKLPESRREECLQRALNLVPDENVMLLAGILMDKTMEREYVELVFNDVLNRDESVKKPIMRQIFKDKSHPCWADTAWILDVTGDLSADK